MNDRIDRTVGNRFEVEINRERERARFPEITNQNTVSDKSRFAAFSRGNAAITLSNCGMAMLIGILRAASYQSSGRLNVEKCTLNTRLELIAVR